MTHELGRPAGDGLIEREAPMHRYRLALCGLRLAAFCTKLADRLLDPAIALCAPGRAPPHAGPQTGLDGALNALLQRANIAA